MAVILIHTFRHKVSGTSSYNDHTQPDVFAGAVGAKGYVKLANKSLHLINGGTGVNIYIGVVLYLLDFLIYHLRGIHIHGSQPVQRPEHPS